MAITAQIGGYEGAGALQWQISYDDATREVTSVAGGTNGNPASGFCLVTVQVTSAVTRTVAYFPPSGGTSVNPDLAARMAAADFRITADGSTVVLASNITPAQVSRLVSKSSVVAGLPSTSEWTRA